MAQVFISYRQLDDTQRQRVRSFAERLRGCGIEVVLDQFYKDAHPGGPPEGWPKWSSDQAIHAEKVIIIGNAPWFRCFDGKEQPGTGLGAACEAGNLRQRIYELGGEQDIIRVAYFHDADVPAISFDLKRYDRFHIERDFDHLVAWVKGTPFVPGGSPETSPRSLRFWSTRESIDRGEITVLAIIETVLAVTLLITLTVWFDTVKWLAGACALAPLVLLRTKKAVQRGAKSWAYLYSSNNFVWRVERMSLIVPLGFGIFAATIYAKQPEAFAPLAFGAVALVCLMPVFSAYGLLPVFLYIRTSATLLELVRHPIECIRSIPQNWQRYVLLTDSHSPPDYLPGTAITSAQIVEFAVGPAPKALVQMAMDAQLPSKRQALVTDSDWQVRWIRRLLRLFGNGALIGLYPFTAAYRWSVKATCLIYLPLVWIANKAQYSPRTSVKAMLHDYLVDDIQRVRRWLAVLSVSALMVKIVVWWHLDAVRSWAHQQLPMWALKVVHEWRHYLDPEHVPWWQITPAINGALAVGLFIYARRVLNLKDHVPADAVVLRNWRIVNVLSAALSVYTIVCVLLLTWKAGDLMGTLHKLWQMLDHRALP